ncbi:MULTISPECIES: SAM-dependent methyltransferase [unclassified Pseudofrankia]|uniref:SAM-dependent methyltransferase n=1 Tax=unclassified Pseudofrankia TaxID=2994372 RepID=UPI000AEE7B79|nr:MULTISPECIES: SAM-dependent methyltransferase [unclassified Pseudofrankia]MDT3439590.1 SAM-dependent methyltransferase [Pseudofrankia sp. BMG5.37]
MASTEPHLDRPDRDLDRAAECGLGRAEADRAYRYRAHPADANKINRADANQIDLERSQPGLGTDPRTSWRHDRASWRHEPTVDCRRPSTSRVYDYFLGGSNHFPVDRELAARLSATLPDIDAIMRENRAFMRRAVRFLLDAGIQQFLDLGSGIPTDDGHAGNVHELARRRRDGGARVVYVDLDPTAVARSRVVLAGNQDATIIQADLRDPDTVFDHPDTRRLLDLARPTAVLILGVLHDIPDADDPPRIIGQIRERLAPGSFLALSQGTVNSRADTGGAGTNAYNDGYARGAPRLSLRGRAQTLALLDGFELVAPGLVFLEDWRPYLDDDADRLTSPARAAGATPGFRAALAGIGMR